MHRTWFKDADSRLTLTWTDACLLVCSFSHFSMSIPASTGTPAPAWQPQMRTTLRKVRLLQVIGVDDGGHVHHRWSFCKPSKQSYEPCGWQRSTESSSPAPVQWPSECWGESWWDESVLVCVLTVISHASRLEHAKALRRAACRWCAALRVCETP